MSSDLFLLDESFFSDEFLDSPIELLQAISDHHQISQNPVQETNYSSSDQMTHPIFSTSPPSNQLENLSLYQTTQFQDFSSLEVKTEECHLFPLSSPYGFESFGHGNAAESVAKMMQRSFSSHSFDGNKPSFSFQPRFDCVAESPHFQPQAMSSPENSFSVGQMRRRIKTTRANRRLSSSPLATESSFIEEANLKVGRYSAEERKERIHRFARNDETGEIPKAANFNRYEDEDDLWIDGYNEEDEERSLMAVGGGGPFFNMLGPTQIQYYGY
ncbi:hypothetical protein C3L33_08536, partial [Rhododendron williamsianum]